jgi:hypothetical protein
MAKSRRGEIASEEEVLPPRKNVKVRATREGLYGIVRQRFEVFVIADMAAFSKRWMEEVEDDEAVTRPELTADGALREEAKITAKRPVPNIQDVKIAGADNVDQERSAPEEAKQERAPVEDPEHAEATPERRQRRRAGAVQPAVHD